MGNLKYDPDLSGDRLGSPIKLKEPDLVAMCAKTSPTATEFSLVTKALNLPRAEVAGGIKTDGRKASMQREHQINSELSLLTFPRPGSLERNLPYWC